MMNDIRPRTGTTAVVALALILGVLTSIGMAEAAVGDLLANVTIPESAGCVVENPDTSTTVYGNVLAVVPGGKLGFPNIPTLVVTSCVRQVPNVEIGTHPVSMIFFLDPSTNPATLVGTVSAGTSPWEALVFRADTADLLGCQPGFEGPLTLSVIHFSPYDTVAAPGNVSFLTTAPATASCDGVAWDAKDKSIYQTSFGPGTDSPPILKYSPGIAANASSLISGCG
jgi:hypothetical protein